MATNSLIALIVGVPALLGAIAIAINDARRSGSRSSARGTASFVGASPVNAPRAAIASAAPPPAAIPVVGSPRLPEASLVVVPEAVAQPTPQVGLEAIAEPTPEPDRSEPKAGGFAAHASAADSQHGDDGVSVDELLAEVEVDLRSMPEREPAADGQPAANDTPTTTPEPSPTIGSLWTAPRHPQGVAVRGPRRSQGRKLLVAAGVGAALVVVLARR